MLNLALYLPLVELLLVGMIVFSFFSVFLCFRQATRLRLFISLSLSQFRGQIPSIQQRLCTLNGLLSEYFSRGLRPDCSPFQIN